METAIPRRDAHLVALDPDHPGFRDPVYRARRDAIAALAPDPETLRELRPGGAARRPVRYTAAEDATWRTVRERLEPVWRRRLHPELLRRSERLDLPRERVPDLARVGRALARVAGPDAFRYVPVAGLVSAPVFLAWLGRGVFLSTEYVRHPSRPHYTPEPDVLHEVLGHAPGFAHPGLARLQRELGRTSLRIGPDGALQQALERVYWWTVEFGLVGTGAGLRAIGAGLASSSAELDAIESGPAHLDFDVERCASTPYDPTAPQERLFVAASLEALVAETCTWARGLAAGAPEDPARPRDPG